MNKNLTAYIEYIKDNYQNANDYILKSSFNELKKTYNVNQLQQKNKEIIEQDREAKSQTVQENVPGDVLEETEDGGAEDEGEAEEEQKGAEEMSLGATDKETDEGATVMSGLSDDDEGATEEIKAIKFLENTIFRLQGSATMGVVTLKKKYLD
jgi:hypothetical protein